MGENNIDAVLKGLEDIRKHQIKLILEHEEAQGTPPQFTTGDNTKFENINDFQKMHEKQIDGVITKLEEMSAKLMSLERLTSNSFATSNQSTPHGSAVDATVAAATDSGNEAK